MSVYILCKTKRISTTTSRPASRFCHHRRIPPRSGRTTANDWPRTGPAQPDCRPRPRQQRKPTPASSPAPPRPSAISRPLPRRNACASRDGQPHSPHSHASHAQPLSPVHRLPTVNYEFRQHTVCLRCASQSTTSPIPPHPVDGPSRASHLEISCRSSLPNALFASAARRSAGCRPAPSYAGSTGPAFPPTLGVTGCPHTHATKRFSASTHAAKVKTQSVECRHKGGYLPRRAAAPGPLGRPALPPKTSPFACPPLARPRPNLQPASRGRRAGDAAATRPCCARWSREGPASTAISDSSSEKSWDGSTRSPGARGKPPPGEARRRPGRRPVVGAGFGWARRPAQMSAGTAKHLRNSCKHLELCLKEGPKEFGEAFRAVRRTEQFQQYGDKNPDRHNEWAK